MDKPDKVSGEVGQHKTSFRVSAGDMAMVRSLIDKLGWNSTNKDVMTIDNVRMTRSSEYDDVYQLDKTTADMLTQQRQEIVENDKETLKVQDSDGNRTGPAVAAASAVLAAGGMAVGRARFRTKL